MTTELLKDSLLSLFPGLQGAYLYGSRAQGYAGSDSDVDLGLLWPFGKSPTAVELFGFANQLEDLLGASVDLVDMRQTNTVMQFQILTTGERILCLDEYACAEFEMVCYSMYQRLEEERKYIMQDILDRGSVYG